MRNQPSLSACSDLTGNDVFEMRRLIGQTAQDGFERGFTKDMQGYHFCVGTRCSVNLEAKNAPLAFHTHPEGTHAGYFSINDLRNSWTEKRLVSCVGFEDENAEPKIKCVRGSDISGEALAEAYRKDRKLKQEAELFHAMIPSPSSYKIKEFVADFVKTTNRVHGDLEKASKVCSEVLKP